MARISLPRFSTVMPTLVTSLGSWASARLTAFCRLTRAMSESVPERKVTEQELLLVEEKYSRSSTPLISFSKGMATVWATTSALAPE